MPVMDGLEACTLITQSKVRLLPIIVFVTAHAMESFRQKAKQAGGFGFISKPFDLPRIKGVLQSIPWDSLTETERRFQAADSTTATWNGKGPPMWTD